MNRAAFLSPFHPARADDAAAHPAFRYCAYLSYSHRDEADAKWLHSALEAFKVPPAMIGLATAHGAAPGSFAPIFRDRQELAASADLGTEIRDALASSRFLIVLCSPAAAVSHWTNQEIIAFKRLRPNGTILAAIVAGEPYASAIPGREAEECFPPALRFTFDKRGRPTTKRAEPIAADLREGRDGRRMGMLKIAAGMLGVGLDDLVRREAHRRQKRMRLVTLASLAGMAVTSALAVTAIQGRDEARDQRREAEGMVGFMLGDLRGKLEPLGRLDVLDAVGARALAYFEKQDKVDLSDEGLAQRSRALTMMGEIAQARGDMDGALRRYREAMAGTREAVRRDPDNAQRLFDHAQNIFWVGFIAWQRGRTDEAAASFREYKRLATRMIAIDPAKPAWRLEEIYADTNLGTVLLEQRRYGEAAATYQASLSPIERLAAAEPRNLNYQKQLLETLGYLGDARERAGQLDAAISQRERQLGLIERLLIAVPGDIEFRRKAMVAHRAMGRLFAARGDPTAGIAHGRNAIRISTALVATEPDNTEWLSSSASAYFDSSDLMLAAGSRAEAAAAARAGCDITNRLIARDSSVVSWNEGLRSMCRTTRIRLALASGANFEALGLSREATAAVRSGSTNLSVDQAIALAVTRGLAGDAYWGMRDLASAQREWRAAFALWPKATAQTPVQLANLAILLRRTGQESQAVRLAERLARIGYRHPDYLQRFNQGGTA